MWYCWWAQAERQWGRKAQVEVLGMVRVMKVYKGSALMVKAVAWLDVVVCAEPEYNVHPTRRRQKQACLSSPLIHEGRQVGLKCLAVELQQSISRHGIGIGGKKR